jgi:hypothetical protein
VNGLPLDHESGQEVCARALPHDWPRRDCLGRKGSVGADGANKKRQLERFFVLNRRAEGAGQRREEIG